MALPESRFNQLYEDHHQAVHRCLRRRTDADSARECTADTFVVAWRKLDDIPSGRSELSWLLGVAWRQLANRHRSVRRGRTLVRKLAHSPRPAPESPETAVLRHEDAAQIRRALSRLRPDDQEVLRLATWEDLPHAEIAVVLKCSRHSVDQRIHRATRRLAREMAVEDRPEVSGVASASAGGSS